MFNFIDYALSRIAVPQQGATCLKCNLFDGLFVVMLAGVLDCSVIYHAGHVVRESVKNETA